MVSEGSGEVISGVYLNRRLFWIKECGHSSFLIRKYDQLPIHKLDLYKAKGLVFLKMYGVYLLVSVIIYYENIFANYLTKALWLEPIPDIVISALFGFLVMGVYLGVDFLQDIRTST